MKVRDHAMLASALLAVHAALQTLGLLVLGIVAGYAAAYLPNLEEELARELSREGVPEEAQRLIVVVLVVALIIALVIVLAQVVLAFFAAWGLWKARPWAKVVTTIVCAISVLSFPFGTALGAYGLWFTLGRAGSDWFASSGRSDA